MRSIVPEIFSSAEASALGRPGRTAAPRSAANSRERDSASLRTKGIAETASEAGRTDIQLGRVGGGDLAGAGSGQRDLVAGEELEQKERRRDEDDRHSARAGGEQDADEDDVDGAQQEDGEQHPGLEPGVASEG